MRLRVLPLVALLLIGCGKSPAAPSSTPPPPPPPAPTYPSMLGAWQGQLVIVGQSGSSTASNTCTISWSVTSQTADSFSGTFQLTGGTLVTCAQSGELFGIVQTDNHIGVAPAVELGVNNTCQRTSGDGVFLGVLVNGTASMTTSESLVCLGNTPASRTMTMTVSH